MNELKVLILEDNQGQYKTIKDCLDNLSFSVRVIPEESKFSELKDQFHDYHDDSQLQLNREFITVKNKKQQTIIISEEFRNDKIKERNDFFEELIDVSINIYIVDIALKGDSDRLGKEFIKYLKENHNYDYSIVVYSSYIDNIKDEIDFNEDNDLLINKTEAESEKEASLINFLNKKSRLVEDNKDNKKRKLRKTEIWFRSESQHNVDNLIKFIFLLSMAIVSVVSLIKIILGSLKMLKSSSDETAILNFVEHLFLYVLPIFILLGFYNYYRYDLRGRLLKFPTSPEDSKSARNSIQLSKTLFLSSIMAYVIIKIVENLFIVKSFNFELEKVISFGVLLVLIMTYLIITHKDH